MLAVMLTMSCNQSRNRELYVDTKEYTLTIRNNCEGIDPLHDFDCKGLADLQHLLVDDTVKGIYYRRGLEVKGDYAQPFYFSYACISYIPVF